MIETYANAGLWRRSAVDPLGERWRRGTGFLLFCLCLLLICFLSFYHLVFSFPFYLYLSFFLDLYEREPWGRVVVNPLDERGRYGTEYRVRILFLFSLFCVSCYFLFVLLEFLSIFLLFSFFLSFSPFFLSRVKWMRALRERRRESVRRTREAHEFRLFSFYFLFFSSCVTLFFSSSIWFPFLYLFFFYFSSFSLSFSASFYDFAC